MNPRTAIRKLQLRLNKSDSRDYDNIPDDVAVEAINKEALGWCRRQIHGGNLYKEGDEESKMRVDDLQILLKPKSLRGKNHKTFFESEELPEDYLWYKRVIPTVSKGECSGKTLSPFFVEEANVPTYLADENWQPSFKWEQTFLTLVDNKIRVYTDNDFTVTSLDLLYYRKPIKMDIRGYIHEDGTESKNTDLEFKDDIAELIIDGAAAIIAGDIESGNQVQINQQRSEQNN